MASDIVQTAITAFDGVEFTHLLSCEKCGGPVQGYDSKTKKFAVLQDGDRKRVITVQVRRFTCRNCKSLCYADEPFYPGTRIGSIIIDLFFTLATTMPRSRAARVIEAMGIVVDRTTWQHYTEVMIPDIQTADVFGMRLPFSVLSVSGLAAACSEGGRIIGTEALAACGFPSAYRAPANVAVTVQKRDKRDKEEEKEKGESEQKKSP
jgi:predicted nucleic-acid-binding Zn-ribbon protein